MEQHDNGLLAYIKYQQFEQAITNKAEEETKESKEDAN